MKDAPAFHSLDRPRPRFFSFSKKIWTDLMSYISISAFRNSQPLPPTMPSALQGNRRRALDCSTRKPLGNAHLIVNTECMLVVFQFSKSNTALFQLMYNRFVIASEPLHTIWFRLPTAALLFLMAANADGSLSSSATLHSWSSAQLFGIAL